MFYLNIHINNDNQLKYIFFYHKHHLLDQSTLHLKINFWKIIKFYN